MPLIRYPGSKEKLAGEILAEFPIAVRGSLWSSRHRWEYREPFFGAGAIGFHVLEHIDPDCAVWLNDIDPGMVALWTAVKDDPERLMNLINQFTPTAEAFYKFKEEDGRVDLPVVEAGFRKLALHRMSFSGLGFKAGGPIGGRNQTTATYNVGCRWRRQLIVAETRRLNSKIRAFQHLKITCGDFAPLIDTAPQDCFVYVDPPYYQQGPALYKHAMSDLDHDRLAASLKACRASWVASYDDHPAIRGRYAWAAIKEVKIVYTTATHRGGGERPKNQEILIAPERQAALSEAG